MRKSRHFLAILMSGLFLFDAPMAYCWPVFDFGENPQIITDVKNEIKTIKEMRDQLVQVNEIRKRIGDNVNSLMDFTKNFKENLEQAVEETVNKVGEGVGDLSGQTDENIQTGSQSTQETTETQADVVDEYVDDVEDIINEDDSPNFDGNNGYTSSPNVYTSFPNTSYNKPQYTSSPNVSRPYTSSSNGYLPYTSSSNSITFSGYEEEEEEEEVKMATTEDIVKELLRKMQDKQEQLAIELNDNLDSLINMQNISAKRSIDNLKDLDTLILRASKINETDKAKLHQQINSLISKQEDVWDSSVRILETVKENYNKEYNENIKDGVNNYTKLVIAHLHGDINKDEIKRAGKKLKEKVHQINVMPNKAVLAELNRASENLYQDTENLKKEINRILKSS